MTSVRIRCLFSYLPLICILLACIAANYIFYYALVLRPRNRPTKRFLLKPRQQPTRKLATHFDNDVSLPTPPPVSQLFPSLPAPAANISALSFIQPRIIVTYVRPSLLQKAPAYDIFAITTAMYLRNLTASTCVVNGKHYQVQSSIGDVTMCTLPQHPADGSSITLALADDDGLHASLHGELEFPGNFQAKRLRLGTDLTILQDGSHAIIHNYTLRQNNFDVFDTPHADESPRYALCHATMIKPGGEMLEDWVDHHRRLGVDHVFIFDNGASPPPRNTFATRNDVEVITWPWAKTQELAFAYAIFMARRRCRHIFFSDVDEFVMVGLGKSPFANGRRPFHGVISDVEQRGFQHLQFRNFHMVNSGYIHKPAGHVPELYTHARQEQKLDRSKSVCALDIDWRAGRVHSCGLKEAGVAPVRYTVPRKDLYDQYAPKKTDDVPFVVHFSERSWEEYVEKWDVGAAGVTNRLERDGKLGRFTVDNPLYEHIDLGRPGITNYTSFRESWRRVRYMARSRIDESVLLWKEGEELVRRVVIVNQKH